MADNYLERRMEEHLRGGGEQAVKRVAAVVASSRLTERDLVVRFPALRVVIAGTDDVALTEALAGRFRSIDAKVALVGPKDAGLTKMGQRRGCRVYQADHSNADELRRVIDDATRAWGGVDVVIVTQEPAEIIREMAKDEPGSGSVWLQVENKEGNEADDVALATLMAVHRSSRAMRSVEKLSAD